MLELIGFLYYVGWVCGTAVVYHEDKDEEFAVGYHAVGSLIFWPWILGRAIANKGE